MHIREYKSKDATHLFNINKACFNSPEPNLTLLKNIHNGQTWVCCLDNDIPIGFLISVWNEGPHVYNIAVHPDFQAKGIGKSLLEEFHKFYREQEETHLRVDSSNSNAQKLYFNMGYRVHHIECDYYGRGKDAFYMIRSKRDLDNL